MHCISAPSSIQELEKRFKTITGLTIYEIADILNVYIPNNLKKYKGFIGLLLEKYLGATASNKPQPDFINLGIEMKTLPLNKNIQPKESTYICKVPLTNDNSNWEQSRVLKKLSHVLWVPFEASEHIPLKKRKRHFKARLGRVNKCYVYGWNVYIKRKTRNLFTSTT